MRRDTRIHAVFSKEGTKEISSDITRPGADDDVVSKNRGAEILVEVMSLIVSAEIVFHRDRLIRPSRGESEVRNLRILADTGGIGEVTDEVEGHEADG